MDHKKDVLCASCLLTSDAELELTALALDDNVFAERHEFFYFLLEARIARQERRHIVVVHVQRYVIIASPDAELLRMQVENAILEAYKMPVFIETIQEVGVVEEIHRLSANGFLVRDILEFGNEHL
jgi:hypothetical protein